jgi:hypothetical protein
MAGYWLVPPSFAPTDIAGLQVWLKADGIAGKADGDPISQWDDLSGHGQNAVQVTGSKQPTYKTAIQNGLPVVRFDGVDDFMQATGVNVAQPDTIFAVAKTSTLGTFVNVLDGQTTRQAISKWNTDVLAVHGGTTDVVTSQAWNSTTFHLVSYIPNGASSQVWFDSASVTLGSNPGTANLNLLNVGTYNTLTSFWNGDIAEILIYDTGLSTGNRTAVEDYLRTKWATP